MSNSAIQSMRSIDRFLREVAATEKRAAEAHTEPGSVGGGTTHPVKGVDDSTEKATEGFRSQENEADVKADEGPASVDNTPEGVANKKAAARKKVAVDGKSESSGINPPGTAASDQLQIGTRKAPTGEDPAVETSSVKSEKEDSAGTRLGSTTHPARTNNSELDGYKYAEMTVEKLAAHTANLGNSLLAKLAELTGDQHKLDVNKNNKIDGADLSALRKGKAPAKAEEKAAVDLAGQAGWDLAGLVSGNFDKQAADALVFDTVQQIIKTASDDADKVAYFIAAFQAQQHEMAKEAMGEMPQGVDPAMMGGSPEAAMMPPGGGEGGEGGGESDLASLAAQLGITPEELIAAVEAEAGHSEGGEDEEAANAPPGMEVEAAFKAAADAMAAVREAKEHADKEKVEKEKEEKAAAAKKGAAEKTVRDYMQEVLARSRK
jgi:hypothetical protein